MRKVTLSKINGLSIRPYLLVEREKFLWFFWRKKKKYRLLIKGSLIVDGDVSRGDILLDLNGVDYCCIRDNEIVLANNVVEHFELSSEFVVVSRSFCEGPRKSIF